MKLRRLMIFRILLVLSMLWIGLAYAGSTAQQKVIFKVNPINTIYVSEDLSHWSITTNEVNKRVMARIKTPGVTLTLEFEAPSKGISEGSVTLTGEMQCLVKNISKVAQGNLKIYCENLSGVERGDLEFILTD
ncbi:MAG: hypothetical protein WBF13_10280 [Candidatus Zixiibacteriota bacterium]